MMLTEQNLLTSWHQSACLHKPTSPLCVQEGDSTYRGPSDNDPIEINKYLTEINI